MFKCCSSGLVFVKFLFPFIYYLVFICYFFFIICCVPDKVFAPTRLTQEVYEEGAKDVALSTLSGIDGNLFSTNCYCIRISLSFRLWAFIDSFNNFMFFSLFY